MIQENSSKPKFLQIVAKEKDLLQSKRRQQHIPDQDTDYFGIALSGGGIRSATVNLGVLGICKFYRHRSQRPASGGDDVLQVLVTVLGLGPDHVGGRQGQVPDSGGGTVATITPRLISWSSPGRNSSCQRGEVDDIPGGDVGRRDRHGVQQVRPHPDHGAFP